MTHKCVSKLSIIGSGNGLSPGRRQAIIWTNAGILLIWTIGTDFNEMLIEIHTFSVKKIHLKMSSAKWQPFCLGLNVLYNLTWSDSRHWYPYLKSTTKLFDCLSENIFGSFIVHCLIQACLMTIVKTIHIYTCLNIQVLAWPNLSLGKLLHSYVGRFYSFKHLKITCSNIWGLYVTHLWDELNS